MKKKEEIIGEAKILPHDTDTEQAVLATLMRYNDKFDEYSDLLNEDLFYYPTEKAVYRCIAGVIKDGGLTDINSLFNYYQSHEFDTELFRSDFLNIFQLSNTQTLGQDIRRLNDMGRRRSCWRILQQAASKVLDLTEDYDEEINGMRTAIDEVSAGSGGDEITTFDESMTKLEHEIEENRHGKRQSLITGFKLIDDKYLLSPNKMTVIAAFTSVGKSALALNIAMNVAKQGEAVAYYSLEMSHTELVSRAISFDMNIPSYVIMNEQLSDRKLDDFKTIKAKLKDLPIYFDDRSTVNFDKTMRSIRTMVKTKNIKMAIIDYLQIYSQMNDDVEKSIAYMAREAKNVAKETGIPVILLSQLNRSGDHPSIKMLRGSGQIEESADNIVLIDRPEAYPENKVKSYIGEFKEMSIQNTAKLILTKGRGVGTGCALIGFDAAHTRFYEIDWSNSEGGKYTEKKVDLPF